MATEEELTPEHRAYREAGHATMSLLLRHGFIERFVPIARPIPLPGFEAVSIEGESRYWGELTRGLGSLLTASQVLIAGDVAERLKFDPPKPGEVHVDSPLVQLALHLVTGYVEEYGGDSMSVEERDAIANPQLRNMVRSVTAYLQQYWACVEALASALLQVKSITESRALEIIAQEIPEEAKLRAEVFAQMGLAPKKRKAWWQFWK
jgi:hypothetical protein